MTDQYAELRAALAAGPTPGPWTGHRMGIEKDRIGEYVQASVNVSPGDDFFFICAKRPDGSDADLCLTGNGPTSAINTQYIIAANPEVIRALLAERDAMSELLASAYQLAGAVDAPVRFLDAFSRHKGRIDDLLPVDATECGQVASVIAERDALAQDAARYRWLRRSNNATLALHLARSECPERMDAEIDAAMAGREGEG